MRADFDLDADPAVQRSENLHEVHPVKGAGGPSADSAEARRP
jgi:hypothetical protein